MATWNWSNKEKHWSKVTNHENHQNQIDFLISPVQKTCEHLVPFSSWFMPSASSKTRLNAPTCLRWKGVRRCCAWHAEDDAGGANNASPVMSHVPVSFNFEVLLQMLQIVQSCSVGISYHHVFSIYLYVLVSIRLLAVFRCVFPFIPDGNLFQFRLWRQAFPMDKVQNGLGAAKSWVWWASEAEDFDGWKTWINMSKVTAEALDLEIETSRFVRI